MTVLDYPDMINDVIHTVLPVFENSVWINIEMKNILESFTRKKDFVYLIKPDSITILATHSSGLLKDFPLLD